MSITHTPLSPDQKPDPTQDGITHINCYSRARTTLGQDLSNFAHKPINHPKYGFFASLEAFWYWLSTGKQHNDLRRLYGATAKTAGLRYLPVQMPVDEFRKEFCDAIVLKIVQNKKLKEAVMKSTLPFRHYYVYNSTGQTPVVRETDKHQWQVDCLEQIRKDLKERKQILLSDGSPAEGFSIKEVIEPVIEDGI